MRTLLLIICFTYSSGWVLFNALENVGVICYPGTSEAIRQVLIFALGVPVLVAQLGAVRYASKLINSLN